MSRQPIKIAYRSNRRTVIRRVVQIAALVLWLWLFFIAAWPMSDTGDTGEPGAAFAADDRGWLSPQLLLWLDPLIGLSSAIAGRSWTPALWGFVGMALLSLVFPRGFCSTVCPLGTLIDGFDRTIGRCTRRWHTSSGGRLTNVRFVLLTIILIAALAGVMLGGYLAAIALLTRGMQFSAGRWQVGLLHDWSLAHPVGIAGVFAIGVLASVFLLGLFGRRFWCRHLCPSGALLSLLGRVSLLRRQTTGACVSCDRCRKACDFQAIAADYSTRADSCTFCQKCADVCPTEAVKFLWRWKPECGQSASAGPTAEDAGREAFSRRAFLTAAAGGAALSLVVRPALAGWPSRPIGQLLRPPGSRDEQTFLSLCIRCGQCMRVCPGQRLRPAGLEAGADALWTPVAVPTLNGCHPQCNRCTQVCPTGAIRPLTMAEKSTTVAGLARINRQSCLPHAGRQECRLCLEECTAAGHKAIRMERVELDIDLEAIPPGVMSDEEMEAMRYIEAPVVDAAACVGCGLCEFRCHSVNVRRLGLLEASAIKVNPISDK